MYKTDKLDIAVHLLIASVLAGVSVAVQNVFIAGILVGAAVLGFGICMLKSFDAVARFLKD